MLDFVSTRPGVDEQTRRCANLLTAIITDSIRCIGDMPVKGVREAEENALASLQFLFDDESPFEIYAQLIGVNAQTIREALFRMSEHDKNLAPGWGSNERRIARIRIHKYLSAKRARRISAHREVTA